MGYFQHMKHSLSHAALLFKGGFRAIAHGMYPDAYVTTTSQLHQELGKQLGLVDSRKDNQPVG